MAWSCGVEQQVGGGGGANHVKVTGHSGSLAVQAVAPFGPVVLVVQVWYRGLRRASNGGGGGGEKIVSRVKRQPCCVTT